MPIDPRRVCSAPSVLVAGAAFAMFCSAQAQSAAADTTVGSATQQRCGWLDNPTPQNVWLRDKDGQWIVSIQGGHEAEGDWPDFEGKQWVSSGNGGYGYGCACMRVQVNAASHQILKIESGTVKPLAACRNDPALKGREPGKPPKPAK